MKFHVEVKSPMFDVILTKKMHSDFLSFFELENKLSARGAHILPSLGNFKISHFVTCSH